MSRIPLASRRLIIAVLDDAPQTQMVALYLGTADDVPQWRYVAATLRYAYREGVQHRSLDKAVAAHNFGVALHLVERGPDLLLGWSQTGSTNVVNADGSARHWQDTSDPAEIVVQPDLAAHLLRLAAKSMALAA